eukprot:5109917-Amphidinium_carterae.1
MTKTPHKTTHGRSSRAVPCVQLKDKPPPADVVGDSPAQAIPTAYISQSFQNSLQLILFYKLGTGLSYRRRVSAFQFYLLALEGKKRGRSATPGAKSGRAAVEESKAHSERSLVLSLASPTICGDHTELIVLSLSPPQSINLVRMSAHMLLRPKVQREPTFLHSLMSVKIEASGDTSSCEYCTMARGPKSEGRAQLQSAQRVKTDHVEGAKHQLGVGAKPQRQLGARHRPAQGA